VGYLVTPHIGLLKVGGNLTLSDPTLVSFYLSSISTPPPTHFIKLSLLFLSLYLTHAHFYFTRVSFSFSLSHKHTNQPPSFSFYFYISFHFLPWQPRFCGLTTAWWNESGLRRRTFPTEGVPLITVIIITTTTMSPLPGPAGSRLPDPTRGNGLLPPLASRWWQSPPR